MREPEDLILVKVSVVCQVWGENYYDFPYEVEVEKGNEFDRDIIGQLLPEGIDDFEIEG